MIGFYMEYTALKWVNLGSIFEFFFVIVEIFFNDESKQCLSRCNDRNLTEKPVPIKSKLREH